MSEQSVPWGSRYSFSAEFEETPGDFLLLSCADIGPEAATPLCSHPWVSHAEKYSCLLTHAASNSTAISSQRCLKMPLSQFGIKVIYDSVCRSPVAKKHLTYLLRLMNAYNFSSGFLRTLYIPLKLMYKHISFFFFFLALTMCYLNLTHFLIVKNNILYPFLFV